MSVVVFDNMIGRTIDRIVRSDSKLVFHSGSSWFKFHHAQDCCESVSIEDVCGDLSDLIGSPMLEAEKTCSTDDYEERHDDACQEWTFYRYLTAKGAVTVRWFGSSNGYYSTSVDYEEFVDSLPKRGE